MRHGEMHVLAGGAIGVAPAGPDRFNLTVVAGDELADELRESGPFDWPTRSPVADGVALVGDAAGYYDPFTGQGIYQAMAAAERLADLVGPALAADAEDDALDRALKRYAAAKRALTRPTRHVQRVVEAVVSRPWLADIALVRLARAAPAKDRPIEVTGDLQPPRSLLSPGVVSSFIFPPGPEHP